MSATQAQSERLVEAVIVAALSEQITDRGVIGFWQSVAEGRTKNAAGSMIAVRVLPRESVGWNFKDIVLRANVVLRGAVESDPRGIAFAAASEAALSVFGEWDTDDDAAAASLDIEDLFRCDAVHFAAGGDCGYDDQARAWFVSWVVEIKGCLL